MISPRRVGRFLGPYFAFCALSGIAGGFIIGALVTIIGLFVGASSLLGGAADGAFLHAARDVGKNFLIFAGLVIGGFALGFGGGFLAGLLSSPIGGAVGRAWSLAAVFFLFFFEAPFLFNGPHGVDFTLFFVILIGMMGVYVADLVIAGHRNLESEGLKTWVGPVAKWLQNSWLVRSPLGLKMLGFGLPIASGMLLDISRVAPEFVQHPAYRARLGNWTTWLESRRLVTSNGYRRSSCQSNLKQIMLGVQQYVQDYDEIYPPKPASPQDGVGAMLQPYLKSTFIFQCPSELYSSSEHAFSSGDFSDYWFNARFYSVPLAKIASPSQSVNWGDGNTGAGEADAAYSLSALPPIFSPATRHLGVANYAFADGHVKALPPNRIATLRASGAGYSFAP